MLLIVAAVGGIAVVDGECQRYNSESPSDPIENCCCLGYNYSTSFNKRRSVVYTLANFCGVKCLDIEGYCGSTSGGGGWYREEDNHYNKRIYSIDTP